MHFSVGSTFASLLCDTNNQSKLKQNAETTGTNPRSTGTFVPIVRQNMPCNGAQSIATPLKIFSTAIATDVTFSSAYFVLTSFNYKLLDFMSVVYKIVFIFSERELKFMFAICHRRSVCRLSSVCLSSVVCDVRAPYSDD